MILGFLGVLFHVKKILEPRCYFSMKIKQILVCSIKKISRLFWQITNIIFPPTYKFSVGKKYFIVGRKEPFIREIFFSSSLKILEAQFNHTQWFKIQKSSIWESTPALLWINAFWNSLEWTRVFLSKVRNCRFFLHFSKHCFILNSR